MAAVPSRWDGWSPAPTLHLALRHVTGLHLPSFQVPS